MVRSRPWSTARWPRRRARRIPAGALIAVGRQGIFFIPALLIGSTAFGPPEIIAAQPIDDLFSFLLVLVLVAQSKRTPLEAMSRAWSQQMPT